MTDPGLFDILFADPADFNCDGTVTQQEEDLWYAERALQLQQEQEEREAEVNSYSGVSSAFDDSDEDDFDRDDFNDGFDSDFGDSFGGDDF